MAFTNRPKFWFGLALSARLLVLVSGVLSGAMCSRAQGTAPFQLRTTGSYLGVRPVDVEDDRAKDLKLPESGGVEITFVEEGSPADHAGVRPGDVILRYNGEKVLGVQQFVRLVAETPPARHVRLVCWRSDGQKELVVVTAPPRNSIPPEAMDLPRFRVLDVPSPIMLWRNIPLGLDSESINEQLAQAFGAKQGILVWSVTPSYPAQRAGLRAGDIVVTVCGRAIHSPRELGVFLQQAETDHKALAVELVRDHKEMTLSLSLDGSR